MKLRIIHTVTTICLTALLLLSASCKTTDITGVFTGAPSYTPSTYGTDALLKILENPDSSKNDGKAAATELSNRTLDESDAQRLVDTLGINHASAVQVQILKTIQTKDLFPLRTALVERMPQITDADAAVECAIAITQFTDDDDVLYDFASDLILNSPHPKVRARATRLLTTYGTDAEPVFLEALETEKSATAATVMCNFLGKHGSDQSFEILEQIANDVDRAYDTDDFLETKYNAESVRAVAVATVESIKRNERR